MWYFVHHIKLYSNNFLQLQGIRDLLFINFVLWYIFELHFSLYQMTFLFLFTGPLLYVIKEEKTKKWKFCTVNWKLSFFLSVCPSFFLLKDVVLGKTWRYMKMWSPTLQYLITMIQYRSMVHEWLLQGYSLGIYFPAFTQVKEWSKNLHQRISWLSVLMYTNSTCPISLLDVVFHGALSVTS